MVYASFFYAVWRLFDFKILSCIIHSWNFCRYFVHLKMVWLFFWLLLCTHLPLVFLDIFASSSSDISHPYILVLRKKIFTCYWFPFSSDFVIRCMGSVNILLSLLIPCISSSSSIVTILYFIVFDVVDTNCIHYVVFINKSILDLF